MFYAGKYAYIKLEKTYCDVNCTANDKKDSKAL